MAKFDLAKFRSDISVLKKQGLIGGADFRTQTAQPWMIRGGKSLRDYVKKYDDILSGKATAVKLSDEDVNRYRRLGNEIAITRKSGTSKRKSNIKDTRVIIPHAATEKVSVRKGNVVITHPKGISRAQLTIEYDRYESDALRKYLKRVMKSQVPNKRRYLGFNFFGNKGSNYYTDIDSLIEDLERYQSVEQAINSGNARDMSEVVRNIEIVTFDSARDWKSAAPPKTKPPKANSKRAYRRRQARLALMPEWKQAENRRKVAERQKKYRDNLTAAEKEAYKKSARERAKKSAKKGKKK